jgi:CheY-like chemotaxis protein
MDLQMPVMDGDAATRAIRARELSRVSRARTDSHLRQ